MISIVIPTYNRESVLCDSIRMLLDIKAMADELIIMDQTPDHEPDTISELSTWKEKGLIRWFTLATPSTTNAMNRGTLHAKGDVILFLDDDIVPSRNLVCQHAEAHKQHPETWAVVGRILQPEDWNQKIVSYYEDTVTEKVKNGGIANFHKQYYALDQDLDFKFNGSKRAWITNVMAGNLSVKRRNFIKIGGFDENFIPPVSYRFETEFARRIIKNGGKIRFEPDASIRHLRTKVGGTRSKGNHMTSASPVHGVGDYYYALCCGKNPDKWSYICKRPFREIRTKFHLLHPWWIPVKIVGELRALRMALQLNRRGPKYIV